MTSVQASNSAEFDTTTTNTTNNQATVPTGQRSATLNIYGDHFNHFPSELYGPVSLKIVPAAVKGADDLYCSKMRSSDLI